MPKVLVRTILVAFLLAFSLFLIFIGARHLYTQAMWLVAGMLGIFITLVILSPRLRGLFEDCNTTAILLIILWPVLLTIACLSDESGTNSTEGATARSALRIATKYSSSPEIDLESSGQRLNGKVLVWSVSLGHHICDNEDGYMAGPNDSPVTVLLATPDPKPVGGYSNGSTAYRIDYHIAGVHLPDGTFLGRYLMTGAPPPSCVNETPGLEGSACSPGEDTAEIGSIKKIQQWVDSAER